MILPKGKKMLNVVFLTNREYLVFTALRYLKEQTAEEMILEWLEYDMAENPDLAEKVYAIIDDLGDM